MDTVKNFAFSWILPNPKPLFSRRRSACTSDYEEGCGTSFVIQVSWKALLGRSFWKVLTSQRSDRESWKNICEHKDILHDRLGFRVFMIGCSTSSVLCFTKKDSWPKYGKKNRRFWNVSVASFVEHYRLKKTSHQVLSRMKKQWRLMLAIGERTTRFIWHLMRTPATDHQGKIQGRSIGRRPNSWLEFFRRRPSCT